MPELPEVETVRRGLQGRSTGQRIEAVQVLRVRAIAHPPDPELFCLALRDTRVREWQRRGKYLLAPLVHGDDGSDRPAVCANRSLGFGPALLSAVRRRHRRQQLPERFAFHRIILTHALKETRLRTGDIVCRAAAGELFHLIGVSAHAARPEFRRLERKALAHQECIGGRRLDDVGEGSESAGRFVGVLLASACHVLGPV